MHLTELIPRCTASDFLCSEQEAGFVQDHKSASCKLLLNAVHINESIPFSSAGENHCTQEMTFLFEAKTFETFLPVASWTLAPPPLRRPTAVQRTLGCFRSDHSITAVPPAANTCPTFSANVSAVVRANLAAVSSHSHCPPCTCARCDVRGGGGKRGGRERLIS